MKFPGLFMICLLFGIGAFAQPGKKPQVIQGYDLKGKQASQLHKFYQDLSTRNAGSLNLTLLAGIPGEKWKGIAAGANSTGDAIYLLAPDHMTCLVPDMSKVEKMPSGIFFPSPNGDPMPNAFPKIEIIPKQGKVKN